MLTICPTPIGNLDDVTIRQRQALAEADVIACEDSRRTGKLLEHLGIERKEGHPRLVAYHEHNEKDVTDRLIRALQRGQQVVLVSDAGTPGISDPGFELIRRVAEADLPLTSLPGPSAAIVALTASGLPMNDFQFRGFPPSGASARQRYLAEIELPGLTTILYESPHRIEELVEDLGEVYGSEHRVCLAREMTKMHEEYLRGTVEEILEVLGERDEMRGEFVVVVAPVEKTEEGPDDREIDRKIRELLEREFQARTIKEIVSELYDVSRSELYDRIHDLQS